MLFTSCRTSHEVRGLKYNPETGEVYAMSSHLTRGAWIEMVTSATTRYCRFGRTSHEVYGRSFGVSMNQFRDLHLKSHLTIAFLFTYNNKKGREW